MHTIIRPMARKSKKLFDCSAVRHRPTDGVRLLDCHLTQNGVSNRRCFLLSFGAGALNGFGMICNFQVLTLIESSMAAMIITMSPLVVLTLLALRGERFTYRHFVRLGLALVGACLLIGPGGEVNLLGVAFVMVAILSFALQQVLIQWFLRPYPARSVTFYQLIAMTIAVVVSGGGKVRSGKRLVRGDG